MVSERSQTHAFEVYHRVSMWLPELTIELLIQERLDNGRVRSPKRFAHHLAAQRIDGGRLAREEILHGLRVRGDVFSDGANKFLFAADLSQSGGLDDLAGALPGRHHLFEHFLADVRGDLAFINDAGQFSEVCRFERELAYLPATRVQPAADFAEHPVGSQ